MKEEVVLPPRGEGELRLTIWLRDPLYEYKDIALLIDRARDGDMRVWVTLLEYIVAGHPGLKYHRGEE